MNLTETLNRIRPVDPARKESAQRVLDQKTKPVGSLGRLEEFAVRFVSIRGDAGDGPIRKRVYTFASDHGIAAEGVSAYPASVTPQMVRNFIAGGAAINVLSAVAGTEIVIVDVGVNADFHALPGLRSGKIARGTANFLTGKAMTEDQALAAVGVGLDLSREAETDGIHLVGTGDMGIGNTTASTAVVCALLGLSPEEVTGRGTGLDDQGRSHKVAVIRKALDLHRNDLKTPLGVLSSVGGFEIGAICGLLLGLAARGIPGVVDGFISTAGAALAITMNPATADYLFFSHLSGEQGHRKILERLRVEPMLDFGMRLGEGTGAALAMPIIEAAVEVYRKMATFESAGVDRKSS